MGHGDGTGHGAHIHFPVGAEGGAVFAQRPVRIFNMDHLTGKGGAREALEIVRLNAVVLAVDQRDANVAPILENLEFAAASVQGGRWAGETTVIDGDIIETIRLFINVPDEETVGAHVADEDALLLLENQRRFAAF